MSRQSPDILKPCGGTGSLPVLGGCWQQYVASSQSQSVWENVTKVVDYHSSGWQSTGIGPYARPYSSWNATCFGDRVDGGDDCQVQLAGGPGVGRMSTDLPATCSFLNCSASIATVNQSIYHNCYHQLTTSVNMAACKHVGYKNLVASKIWHGMHAYTSRYWSGITDSFDWCVQCGIHNYDSTPDPTKYRTLIGTCAVTVNGHWYDGDTDTTHYWTLNSNGSGTSSIDRYSGKVTGTYISGSSVSGDLYPGGQISAHMEYGSSYALGELSLGNSDAASWLFLTYNKYSADAYRSYGLPSVSGGGNAWHLHWDKSAPGIWHTYIDLTIDMDNFTLTYYENQVSYPGPTVTDYINDSVQFSATSVHRTYTYVGETEFDGGMVTEDVTCYLSDTYTSDDLKADWLDLIRNYFDIGNEVNYPWRYRYYENNTNSPIIARDEVRGNGPSLLSGPGPYDWSVNGTVIGDPAKATAPFWNGKHENWSFGIGACAQLNLRDYGAWGGQNGVPNASTKWANALEVFNNYDNTGIFPGSYVWFNTSTQTLWGAIEAEILTPAKGYNWARPCGALDRFQLDVNSANCIDHVSSSTVTLNLYNGQTNHLSGAFTCSIWGTDAATNGIWVATGDGATTVTLNKQVISGSDLPANLWGYAADTTFAGGMIAKNRWMEVHPFCGRVDIIGLTKTTPITMSLMELQRGILNGDRIIVNGCTGSTELNGNAYSLQPLSASNHTQYILMGSVSCSLAYTSSGYVEVSNSVDWKWNSDASRQNYVIGTFDESTYLRTKGEYDRLQVQSASAAVSYMCDATTPCSIGTMIDKPADVHSTFSQSCVAYNPCSPNAIAIMPTATSHSFKYAAIHPFNTSYTIDSKYGNLWQSWIIQVMPDPLYQGPPPAPCRGIYTTDVDCQDTFAGYGPDIAHWRWDSDNGYCLGITPLQFNELCQADPLGQDYFSAVDMYEAVSNVPTGAPSLPAGISLTGSYAVPPSPGGALQYAPWFLYLSKENCVCSSGRFSQYYQRNGVGCSEADTPLL